MSLPPEIAPREAARVDTVWPGLNVVEDVLGQLGLALIERPAGEPQALGIMVPIGQPPPLLGDAGLPDRFACLLVGTGNLHFELPVVPRQRTDPGGDAADQPACQKDDDPE